MNFNDFNEHFEIEDINSLNIDVLIDENKLTKNKNGFLKSGWQTVITPDYICKDLVNTINRDIVMNENNYILVLFNVNIIKILLNLGVKEKNIFYIADSKERYDMIHNNFSNIHIIFLGENDWNIDSLNKKLKEFKMKKFSMVFSNPPYAIGSDGGTFEEKNLDLVFLDEIFKQSDRVSFVMTARFMIRKDMKQKRIDLSKYCESITLFEGNAVFGILVTYPLCIINLNKNKKPIEKIKINDNYYSKSSYEITDLDHFNKYGFENWELDWWNNFINTLSTYKDTYINHCIGWKEFNAPLGFYLGSATSAYDGPRVINDMVTTVDNAKHVFTDKNIIVANVKSEKYRKASNNQYFIVPIKTKQDGININKSYKEEIIRAIIDVTKNKQRIYKCTVETLPWPVDENGNIKYFTNKDWVKKLNIPDSIAKKIINYYNNNPGLKIKK